MGGRVFGTTQPIKKADIKPTLKAFFKELNRVFPDVHDMSSNVVLLGSAGKKPESGDLDIGLNEAIFEDLEAWNISQEELNATFNKVKSRARTATDKQLLRRSLVELLGQKIERGSDQITTDIKNSGSGTLFCEFPQYNSNGKTDKMVQVDLMIGNPELLKFTYYSDGYGDSKILKGLHRTQLIVSLFANKGLTFGHNYGVKDKETGKIIADTPKKIRALLQRLYGVEFPEDILKNYGKLQKFIHDNLSEEDLDGIKGTYLRILDKTHCDIPEDLRDEWLTRQDELGLTGKYLPADSVLYPFKTED